MARGDDPLIVSSLKSQVGHMGAAAGLAGLIRAVLAMRNGVFPPNLHFKTPNPELELHKRKIEVPAVAQPWIAKHRRAGISSFGIGGTNVHAIISQFDGAPCATAANKPEVLLISAHSEQSLKRWANQIADFLEIHPDCAAETVRFLQHGTPQRSWRAGFVWQDITHAIQSLREITGQKVDVRQADLASESDTPQKLCDAWLSGMQLPHDGAASPAPFGFPTYPFDIDTYDFPRKVSAETIVEHRSDRLPPCQLAYATNLGASGGTGRTAADGSRERHRSDSGAG